MIEKMRFLDEQRAKGLGDLTGRDFYTAKWGSSALKAVDVESTGRKTISIIRAPQRPAKPGFGYLKTSFCWDEHPFFMVSDATGSILLVTQHWLYTQKLLPDYFFKQVDLAVRCMKAVNQCIGRSIRHAKWLGSAKLGELEKKTQSETDLL